MLGRLLRMKVLGVSLSIGAVFFVTGILFWGGFHWALEATNTLSFCQNCHEMKDNVYTEYVNTVHYENRTGVRAMCSDCHVPDPWAYKLLRKVKASLEVFHWMIGTIDTQEKFEAKRLTLAKNVWKAMKDTDSRECRNCHSWDGMSKAIQKPRASKQHETAQKDNMTCIDCHKGIAHRAIHKLLPEDYPVYDGKADTAFKLPVVSPEQLKAEMRPTSKTAITPLLEQIAVEGYKPAATAAAPAAAAVPGVPVDWAKVPASEVMLLYPGQASIEWLLKGSDHGGGRAIRKSGDRCFECHGKEVDQMGAKIVSGQKVEPTPIPGKRGHIPVAVKAAHDDKNLYMQFQWADAPHAPVPFAAGGKLDPDNQVKLTMMVTPDGIDMGSHAGCWVTCHSDSRYMPDAPTPETLAATPLKSRIETVGGITKYLPDSRTDIEISLNPRGGWNKLKPEADIAAMKANGLFMDIVRFKSGGGGKSESGYILEGRHMEGGQPVTFQGGLAGGFWTVVMTRPLKAEKPGFASFEPGKLHTVTFAIHDDHAAARFHHVSLDLKLGLDNAEGQINAVKQ